MKIIAGLIVAFAVGFVCRTFVIPSPAPPLIEGALLVMAMTVGYLLVDRVLARPAKHAKDCGGADGRSAADKKRGTVAEHPYFLGESAMSKMRVWCFEEYGAPTALKLQEREIPKPGPGEVLIKVAATAINPSDVKNVSGHFKSPTPRVPGRDYAGTIVAGDGREGEEVWGSGPGFGVARDGVHAEYFVMPSAWVSRKPPALSMEQAAVIGVPYLAAWSALVTAGEIQAGETVLVTGVSGAVGRAATQIAHWKQARVIGASMSLDNPSGADAMIDTTQQDLAAEVQALTGSKGADLVLDVIGGALFEPCLHALRRGGRQVAISSNPQVVNFNLVDFYHGLKRLVGVDTMGLGGADIVTLMDQMRAGFEEGVLQPPAIQTWSFDQAVDAYKMVAQGGASVKHVLTT